MANSIHHMRFGVDRDITIDKYLLSIVIDFSPKISDSGPSHRPGGDKKSGLPATSARETLPMAQMNKTPALISCDEAGFTGPKLLDDDQPMFAYAAIDLSADEATALVTEIKAQYRIQAPELKSKSSRKRADWSAIALYVAQRATGRVIMVAADKRLNLGGKALNTSSNQSFRRRQASSTATTCIVCHERSPHVFFIACRPLPRLAHELEPFMKSFNPAPTLFTAPASEE